MLRNPSTVRLLALACRQTSSSQQVTSAGQPALLAALGQQAQQFRFIGGDKIPEFWGKPSKYTEGTAFLGTPPNHLDTLNKRPLSPDVFDIDGKNVHYKLPWAALSSITNRGTGVVMSVGAFVAAAIALRGDLPGTVAAISSTNAILLFPFKFAVSYTIVYHWLGGMRHFLWDHTKIGNMAEKGSVLELPAVDMSSKILFIGAGVISFAMACM